MRSAVLCSLLAHAARAQDPAYLWEQTVKPGDTVFAGRNGHASAVFLDNLSEWIKVETTCCGTAFNHQDFELYRHQSKGEVTYHAMYKGCQCDTEEYVGEFCEKINDKYQAAAPRTAVGSALVVLVVVGLDFFLLWR